MSVTIPCGLFDMTNDTWQDLYDSWKDSLEDLSAEGPQSSERWFSIWRMIIEHPWFQRKLDKCVGYTVRASRLSDDLTDDIRHEVVLMLAGKLACKNDLGMDLRLASETFPAFLGTIIRNDCRQAARKLRRLYCRTSSLPDLQCIDQEVARTKSLIDLSMDIEKLEDPQRTILLLRLKGLTLKEISASIDMNYWTVCREYHHGCRRLQKQM